MIKEFQGKYRFLSNFTPCPIFIDGQGYRSVEHAFMSMKSNDPSWKKFCQTTESPGYVKKESRKIKLIENWEEIKINAMKLCIDQKFSKEPFKTLLLETYNVYIQEGNYWGDTYWGVDLKTEVGKNILGELIMGKREKLKQTGDPKMKVNYEEIKNFCNATSSVVNNDKYKLFCIPVDEATEILYRYVEDDENDPDSIVFTKDEDEAMEVFQELYDKLDEDSVLMYEENEYDEEDDVNADLLAKTLAFIKKKFKTKDKKKEDKKEEPKKDKKETKKEEVEASITVELNDFVDFYNEIKTLIEDDTILMDAKHVKETPKESNIDKIFKAIEEELVEEDLDELSEKSLEFFKKCTGKVIVVESKKKEEVKEIKEEKKKEVEEPKIEEKTKKGRKKTEDIKEVEKAIEEVEAEIEKEIKEEMRSYTYEKDGSIKAKEEAEHACCGKCQETKEEGILSSVKEPKSPLTITFAPVIDKGFVIFLQDVLDAIKKYQGE